MIQISVKASTGIRFYNADLTCHCALWLTKLNILSKQLGISLLHIKYELACLSALGSRTMSTRHRGPVLTCNFEEDEFLPISSVRVCQK